MKFPVLPVSDAGVTKNFEYLIAVLEGLGGDGPAVTTLPADADEGDIVSYVHGGVVQRLQYLPTLSTAKPWHFVGGSPQRSHVDGGSTETLASAGYVYQDSTNGPSVATALAGDYVIQWGVQVQPMAAPGGQLDTAIFDTTNTIGTYPLRAGQAQYALVTCAGEDDMLGSPATTWHMRIAGDNATVNGYITRGHWLTVTPIRVSA